MDKILCPFHEEQTPSCHIVDDRFWCFGCGRQGHVSELKGTGLMNAQDWARFWLDGVSARTKASVEDGDVKRIAEYWAGIQAGTTTHRQLLDHMEALVSQYELRGRD